MTDCGVCLYSDSDNWEGYIDDAQNVITECDQKCCECGKIVKAGELIEKATWMNESEYEDVERDEDGEPIEKPAKEPIYTCLVCAEIANAFYCDGRVYQSDLWEAMYEVMGDLNSSCFAKLKTPAAKAELQKRFIAFKGLASPAPTQEEGTQQ